ncbi:AAA family ATPase [Candidatus Nomurabacteria bacterium]|nr:AAA family ATPase [Candidatus Nomurabacteria bacterium]
MINTPILHPRTKLLADSYLKSPSQALILSGPSGIGKKFIAGWLADQLELQAITITVEPEKKMIGIDQIQQLYVQTRSSSRLCIIIEDSHLMTQESQNAFLKLLEEPTENAYFMMTTNDPAKMLATIKSRSQAIAIHTPPPKDIEQYVNSLNSNISSDGLSSLIGSTQGLPGKLMSVLESDETLKTHQSMITEAKNFLSSLPKDRLDLLSQKNFESTWVIKLVDNLALILVALLKVAKKDSQNLRRISKQAKLIEQTSEALAKSGNPKIHLTKLALEL